MKHGSERDGQGWSRLLYAVSLVFLAFGLANLGWAVWPSAADAVEILVPVGVLLGAPEGSGFSSLAEYSLALSWSRWLRVGELGQISLGLTKAFPGEDQLEDDAVQILLVEPSLFGLPIDPPGRTQVNLARGQDLSLTWEVEAQAQGTYEGQVVIAFGFYDQDRDVLVPVPVAVVDLSIQVIDLWGQGRGLAIWFGVIGLILWGALFVTGRLVQLRKLTG